MKQSDMTALIGQKGSITVGDMKIRVKILDIRVNYGRTDALITPLGGEGKQWVRLNNVEMEG